MVAGNTEKGLGVGGSRNFQLEAKIANSFAYHFYRKFELGLGVDLLCMGWEHAEYYSLRDVWTILVTESTSSATSHNRQVWLCSLLICAKVIK